MERRDADIERDPVTGPVHEQRVVTEEPGVPPAEAEEVRTFNPAWRATQLVYLFFARNATRKDPGVSGQAPWCPALQGRSTTPPSWCRTRRATYMSPTGIAMRGCTALRPTAT